MPLFIKKPPTIEAYRFVGDPEVFPESFPPIVASDEEAGTVTIDLGEYQVTVASGDWFLRNEWGSYQGMSNAAFAATYQAVG